MVVLFVRELEEGYLANAGPSELVNAV